MELQEKLALDLQDSLQSQPTRNGGPAAGQTLPSQMATGNLYGSNKNTMRDQIERMINVFENNIRTLKALRDSL